MRMDLESNSTKALRRVKIQRAPSGRLLGCAVMIPAMALSEHIPNSGVEFLDVTLESRPDGILIRFSGAI